MSEELTLNATSTVVTGSEDAYVLTDADGNITSRPVEGLPPIDRANARPYAGRPGVASKCKEICDWFVSFTGMRKFQGKTIVNSLRSFAWIKTMKGFFPTKGTSLFSYVWELNPETNKKQPVGDPLGYKMWTVVPGLDLSVPENVAAFNDGSKGLSVKVMPVASAIGLKTSRVKADKQYDVPRLVYKNVTLVDMDREADGDIIITRVLTNFYLRLQHKNRNWSMPYENGDSVGVQQSNIFSSCTMRKMADVTDSFLSVFEQVKEANADADINKLIEITLKQFLANPDPAIRETKLARVMQLQGRSLYGAHVDALEGGQGSLKYDNDLVDRVCLYAVETCDHYHGVERTIEGVEAKDEFVDFHCRLRKIEDPLVLNAQRLSGRTRLNDGVKVVISE